MIPAPLMDRARTTRPEIRPVRGYLTVAAVLAALLVIVALSPRSQAATLSIPLTDPVGDHTGSIDVVDIVFRCDNSTGDYTIRLTASVAAPFVGPFRVNINLYNPDAGGGSTGPGFFQDVINERISTLESGP